MTARIGAPKTGGRRKGSLDKGERQLVTAEMAGDLMTVYRKLGGVKWLLEFAKNNPAEFLRQGLSRLFPAPQRDDDTGGGTFNTQINFDSNPIEAARRIAFALALGAHSDNTSAPIDLVQDETVEPLTPRRPDAPPEAFPNRWQPPSDAPPLLQPEPEPLDDDRARWVAELTLTAQERADNALVRETRECNLSSYRGGNPAEQGLGSTLSPTSAAQDPRAAQRDRLLARRRDKLL